MCDLQIYKSFPYINIRIHLNEKDNIKAMTAIVYIKDINYDAMYIALYVYIYIIDYIYMHRV